MKLVIVAVRDLKAEAYGRPIFVNAIGQAIRSFQDEVNRPDQQNEMNRHPEDFSLWHLGEYDDQSGLITPLEHPTQIATAAQLVAQTH